MPWTNRKAWCTPCVRIEKWATIYYENHGFTSKVAFVYQRMIFVMYCILYFYFPAFCLYFCIVVCLIVTILFCLSDYNFGCLPISLFAKYFAPTRAGLCLFLSFLSSLSFPTGNGALRLIAAGMKEDGSLEYDALVWSEIIKLICLRRFSCIDSSHHIGPVCSWHVRKVF